MNTKKSTDSALEGLMDITVKANILVRELHDLLDQTNIAKKTGITKQAVQYRAKKMKEE